MSRSYRHTPIIGILSASSEKNDKRASNRAFRRLTNKILRMITKNIDDKIIETIPIYQEATGRGNVYTWAKDGKQWLEPKYRRRRELCK